MLNLKNCKIKNLKVMMMTLMIIFMGFNSHGQEILNENNIEIINLRLGEYEKIIEKINLRLGKYENSIERINLRLGESSSYLIRANNQAIGSVVTSIATGLIGGLLLYSKNYQVPGFIIAAGGGITSLSLGIYSIVNKRKGYKRLGGLRL